MIEVRIPKEIKDYKEKFALGLTLRQIVSVVIMLCITVPLYLWGSKIINEELCSWIVIFVGMFFGAFGFYTHNGLSFEQYLICVLKLYFITPMKRKYIVTPQMDRAVESEYIALYKEVYAKNSKMLKKIEPKPSKRKKKGLI